MLEASPEDLLKKSNPEPKPEGISEAELPTLPKLNSWPRRSQRLPSLRWSTNSWYFNAINVLSDNSESSYLDPPVSVTPGRKELVFKLIAVSSIGLHKTRTQVFHIKNVQSLQMIGNAQPIDIVIDFLQNLTGPDFLIFKLVIFVNRKSIMS